MTMGEAHLTIIVSTIGSLVLAIYRWFDDDRKHRWREREIKELRKLMSEEKSNEQVASVSKDTRTNHSNFS